MLKKILAGWLCLCATVVVAQISDLSNGDSLKNVAPQKYFKTFASIGRGLVRDKGHSAIFYNGLVTETGASYYNVSPVREFEIGFMAGTGLLSAEKPSMYYSQTIRSISIFASRLWTIRPLSNSKRLVRIGPGIQSRINNRINPELFNASAAIENFSSLNLHVKTEWNFSRPAKSGKFLSLFRFKRPERTYTLSYHLIASALPFSYRPGYNFVPDMVVPRADYFANHQIFIGGYELKSEITLTRQLPNGNAFQFGYQWHALASSPQGSRFEMATHSLKVGMLFNYKR
jgi:hypothetical protein